MCRAASVDEAHKRKKKYRYIDISRDIIDTLTYFSTYPKLWKHPWARDTLVQNFALFCVPLRETFFSLVTEFGSLSDVPSRS